jgi:hypothetical protein
MVNFENAKIYKIVCDTTGLVYYGSTCEPTLARRLAKHVGYYRAFLKNEFTFVSSFKVLENNNYTIVLVENVDCESKDQLLARERYYIENNDCVNKNIPGRTDKEYRDDNKDKYKEYREDNKDKLKAYKQQYDLLNKEKISEKGKVQIVCDCGTTHRKWDKNRHQKSKKHQNYLLTLN